VLEHDDPSAEARGEELCNRLIVARVDAGSMELVDHGRRRTLEVVQLRVHEPGLEPRHHRQIDDAERPRDNHEERQRELEREPGMRESAHDPSRKR
jgi:hypothetical protein